MSTYPPATKKPKLADTRPLDIVLGQKGACRAVANSPDSPLSALDRGVSALVARMFHHGTVRQAMDDAEDAALNAMWTSANAVEDAEAAVAAL